MAFGILEYLYMIICLYITFGSLYGLEITLSDYSIYNAYTGSKNLPMNEDIIVFRSQVDYSDDPEAQFVYFQTLKRKDASYHYLCHIDLKHQCWKTEATSAVCACTVITEHVVEVKVSLKVSKYKFKTLLRGIVIRSNDNKQIFSEERVIPQNTIFDFPKTIVSSKDSTYFSKGNEILEYLFVGLSAMLAIIINITCVFHQRICRTKLMSEVIVESKISTLITQNLNHTDLEILKRATDNVTDDSAENDVTDDRYDDSYNKKDELIPFYGTPKTHVTEGGEADLHKHLVGRKKKSGHTQFILVNNFTINHLPEGYHDNDLVKIIIATADLTVRVSVSMTSTERPEFCPNTKQSYAFYDRRGSDVMGVGTGMVRYVEKFTEEYNNTTCQCHKCQHSDTPSKVWWGVMMYTATHVVFDDLESRHTTYRLFYDRHDSSLVTLDGLTVYVADIETDRCLLKSEICDVDILDKLDKMKRHCEDLWKKVNNKYKSSRVEDKLTFIVSHPQVSVGHLINRYVVRSDYTRLTYTTCTCPGSSGALVFLLGFSNDWWYNSNHAHSGVNYVGTNFNGAGRNWIQYG